jgi:hypothetical protein
MAKDHLAVTGETCRQVLGLRDPGQIGGEERDARTRPGRDGRVVPGLAVRLGQAGLHVPLPPRRRQLLLRRIRLELW